MTKVTSLLGAALLVVGSTAEAAFTYATALTPSGGGTAFFSSGTNTVGHQFTVGAADIYVTQLGIFDVGANGLSRSHQVGIFTNSGTLLSSVTIPSGTSATLANSFRYAPITSNLGGLLLSAGQTYYIGASYLGGVGSDGFLYGYNASIDPKLSLTDGNQVKIGSFAAPTQNAGSPAILFGPNFQFQLTPVPEPAVAITNGLLLGGLGLMVWRRRKVARPEMA